jgi:hypothetical protein
VQADCWGTDEAVHQEKTPVLKPSVWVAYVWSLLRKAREEEEVSQWLLVALADAEASVSVARALQAGRRPYQRPF